MCESLENKTLANCSLKSSSNNHIFLSRILSLNYMDLGAFDFIIVLGEREKLLSISATVLKKIYNVSVRRKL